jgi:citrate lyase synthetase
MEIKKLITELENIYTLLDVLEMGLYKRGRKDDDFTKKVATFIDDVNDELSFLEALNEKEKRAASQAARLERRANSLKELGIKLKQ